MSVTVSSMPGMSRLSGALFVTCFLLTSLGCFHLGPPVGDAEVIEKAPPREQAPEKVPAPAEVPAVPETPEPPPPSEFVPEPEAAPQPPVVETPPPAVPDAPQTQTVPEPLPTADSEDESKKAWWKFWKDGKEGRAKHPPEQTRPAPVKKAPAAPVPAPASSAVKIIPEGYSGTFTAYGYMESLVVGNRDISLGVGILPSYHRLENDIVPLLVTVINVTNTSIHISPDVFTLVDTHGNSHAPIPMGDLSVIYPSYTFENRYLESSEFSRIFIAHVDQTIPTLFYPPVGNLIVDNVDLDYGHRMVDMLYFQVPAVDSEGVYTLSLYIGRGFPSLEVRFPIPAFSGKKKDRR